MDEICVFEVETITEGLLHINMLIESGNECFNEEKDVLDIFEEMVAQRVHT